jgi:hypothetical protein
LDASIGLAPRYLEYVTKRGKNGYEIEHVWANHPDRHRDEFSHPSDFEDYRNRIGGLLLLPKSFNASYGDLPYREKRNHYLTQNILAQTFHEQAYERNPGLRRFNETFSKKFQALPDFTKENLDERTAIYLALAERIWDPAQLLTDAISG